MRRLSLNELERALPSLTGWQLERETLVRTFVFEDFPAAVRFVDRLALVAEEAAHHPDIDIRYNRVRLGLTTHDAGGLTQLDLDLAAAANRLG